jgi:hypothetical protein
MKWRMKMRKKTNFLKFIILCSSVASISQAEVTKWICKSHDHTAQIEIAERAISVELDGVTCGALNLDNRGANDYRHFTSEPPSGCEKGDRFEITSLTGIAIYFSHALPDLRRKVLFDFDLFDDLGAHRPFTVEFRCIGRG